MVLRQRRRSGCGQPWLCCYWRVGSTTRQETSRASSMGMVTPGLDSERRNRICRQRSRGSRPTWSTCCPLCHSKTRLEFVPTRVPEEEEVQDLDKVPFLQGGRDLKYRTWNRLSPVICLGRTKQPNCPTNSSTITPGSTRTGKRPVGAIPRPRNGRPGRTLTGSPRNGGLMRLGGGPLSGRKRGRRSLDRIIGPARTGGR